MRKKRKLKKKIGISCLLPATLLLALLPLTGAPKKKPQLETYAIVSGSVFQESGYALSGADVSIAPEIEGGGSPAKADKLDTVSSARGEFTFRVPSGPKRYTVSVAAKDYRRQQKSLAVQDQERVEVTFQLERESK